MGITFNWLGVTPQAPLHFDDKGKELLQQRLEKEAACQTRIRIIVIALFLLLLAAGCATSGLVLAVVIPYGLLHTCVTISAGVAISFGAMGSVAFYVGSNDLVAFIGRCPNYSALERRLHHRNPIRQRSHYIEEISCERSWTYLKKRHQERQDYFQKCEKEARKILEEQFLHDAPKNISTGQPIHTFSPLIDIIAGYTTAVEEF